jgi:hypothetical protein
MLRAVALSALLAGTGAAHACGVCVEDKMAAVYDHAVIGKALGQKHHVAFFHVDGSLAAGEATKLLLERAAEASPSADKGSARVSVESASLAVAFDPQHTRVVALQKDIERRLAAKKLSLMLMQVLERPADVNPSVARALRAAGK